MNRIHQSIVTYIPREGNQEDRLSLPFLLLPPVPAAGKAIRSGSSPSRWNRNGYFTEAIGDKFTVRSMTKGSSPELTTPPPAATGIAE